MTTGAAATSAATKSRFAKLERVPSNLFARETVLCSQGHAVTEEGCQELNSLSAYAALPARTFIAESAQRQRHLVGLDFVPARITRSCDVP